MYFLDNWDGQWIKTDTKWKCCQKCPTQSLYKLKLPHTTSQISWYQTKHKYMQVGPTPLTSLKDVSDRSKTINIHQSSVKFVHFTNKIFSENKWAILLSVVCSRKADRGHYTTHWIFITQHHYMCFIYMY